MAPLELLAEVKIGFQSPFLVKDDKFNTLDLFDELILGLAYNPADLSCRPCFLNGA